MPDTLDQRLLRPGGLLAGVDAATGVGPPSAQQQQQQPGSDPDGIPGEDLPGPPMPALAAADTGVTAGVLLPAAAAGPASMGTTPSGPIDLEAESRRFRLLSLALYGAGAMMLCFPDQFFQVEHLEGGASVGRWEGGCGVMALLAQVPTHALTSRLPAAHP